MSIERCHFHDETYDTDFVERCKYCERSADFDEDVATAESMFSDLPVVIEHPHMDCKTLMGDAS